MQSMENLKYDLEINEALSKAKTYFKEGDLLTSLIYSTKANVMEIEFLKKRLKDLDEEFQAYKAQVEANH